MKLPIIISIVFFLVFPPLKFASTSSPYRCGGSLPAIYDVRDNIECPETSPDVTSSSNFTYPIINWIVVTGVAGSQRADILERSLTPQEVVFAIYYPYQGLTLPVHLVVSALLGFGTVKSYKTLRRRFGS